MNTLFFEKPILHSPYGSPSRHWELDESDQPTMCRHAFTPLKRSMSVIGCVGEG